MPEQFTNLKVFVASPSDVIEERKVLEQVVDELNKLVGGKIKCRLELVKWETDTYPALGNDAQSVINQQVGDDYDIFIGIIWKRIGTATSRGQSGTLEEFYRAYNRAIKDSHIQVMFYFNDSPFPPSEMDGHQLIQIKEFRESLGSKGLYYWVYKSTEEFEKLVRMHLGQAAQSLMDHLGQSTIEEPVHEDLIPNIQMGDIAVQDDMSEDEQGFLDLVIITVDEFKVATQAITRIGELTKEFSDNTEARAAELNNLPEVNPRLAKSIIDRLAEDMNDYVDRANIELPILSKAFIIGIDAYTKMAQLMNDFEPLDTTELQNARSALATYKAINLTLQENTRNLTEVIKQSPRLTTKFNHAKRRVLELLRALLMEYEAEENLTTEAEKMFENVIDGKSK